MKLLRLLNRINCARLKSACTSPVNHRSHAALHASLFLMLCSLLCLAVLIPAHAASLPAGVTNTVVLTDKSGTAQANYPLQFGRPFMQGEIAHYPQVLANGMPLLTQADVKNRYPDGSVKFAVLAVMVPSIPANGSVTLTFQDQQTGNNAPLTAAQMLDSSYNFDAAMKLSNGTATVAASARAMLQNGNYVLWTSGPVAQTIVLADDSDARAYDMGFDAKRSIRPRFQATFWPATHQVTVRYVGENANTIALDNVSYSLALTLGANNPQTVYTNAGLTHAMLTRWTRQAWIGGTPEQRINIGHNLAYLKETRLFPNFDTTVQVPETALAQEYADWQNSPHDLYQKGLWIQYMPTTGARTDIGPFTSWTTDWLYSGDWRARTVALGLADLAGAWPLQAREGDSTKRIDKAQTLSGLGLPISVYGRPSLWFPDNNQNYNQLHLPYTISMPANYPWVPDGAHQPDPYSAAYVLTGDAFYLESLQMWAAIQALSYCTGADWCRGAAGMAGIADQTRGNAWVFRNRALAALWTPDDMPVLKNFFTQMTNDAIAFWEGKAGIAGTASQNTPEWQWANSHASLGTDPLHFFCGTGVTNCQVALWQHYYLLVALGMAGEQGFATGPFLSWQGLMLTGQFTDPGYDIYNLASYWSDSRDASGAYYPTWAQYQTANVASGNLNNPTSFVNLENYYPVVAQTAASFLTGYPGGRGAWNWLKANVQNGTPGVTVPTWYSAYYNGVENTWRILPRAAASGTDQQAPSVPTGLAGTAVSSSRIDLSWKPSTDNAGVTGYQVYRNGALAAVVPNASFSDTGLRAGTAYSYKVAAFDAADNISWYSSGVTITTPAANVPPASVAFSASPSSIGVGQSSTLTWSSTNANSCTGTNFSTGGLTSGSVSVKPSATTTYSVSCTGAGGTGSLSATVTVNAAATYDLVGTDGNDVLTANSSIHSVDGRGGYDVVNITYPAGAYADWYSVIQNADSSFTVKENHTTSGYSLVLRNVEEIVFPDKVHKVLKSVDLTGTEGNDVLTADSGIHSVDGRGGYDVVNITYPAGAYADWYIVNKNADGSFTVKENHTASGYSVVLWNVEEIVFPDKVHKVLQ